MSRTKEDRKSVDLEKCLVAGHLNLSLLKLDNFNVSAKFVIQNEVTSIDFSSNALDTLPDISEYVLMRSLNLSFNNLSALPSLPQSLKELNISHNAFFQCPVMNTVLTLIAAHNKISDLVFMKNVKKLDVTENIFSKIPVFDSLTEIAISANQITAVKDVTFPELVSLVCDSNSIKTFCMSAPKLLYLNLSNNPIQKLDISMCNSLKTLILNNTPASSLLGNLPASLDSLSLQACNLELFPCDILKLSNLRFLNLSANEIICVSPNYTSLALEVLDMSLNFLQVFPADHPTLKTLKLGGNCDLDNIRPNVKYSVDTFPTPPPTRIRKRLHIASFVSAHHLRYLHDQNITGLVFVGDEVPTFFEKSNFFTLHVGLNTEEGSQLLKSLSLIFNFVNEIAKMGNGVLIICGTGVNKSPVVAAAVLMRFENMRMEKAVEEIKGHCPVVDIENGFIVQLKKLEKSILK
ncbi:outer membrane protein yopM, putative [Entamoeba invadens IP1]|uniref:Outer membrane protein yopM, putative n=1 Tax=Entamoeba invadens IP1 TaxID=370355 RepID=A0A0A1U7I6_ENTIV|nr:outer membrane protein yopM, putative [Entamoeba invadens IP1]ELP89011.1 outer membrane protein yopM, putative [Entamoeba invadens IP1]|eukprot:XP_004255782.1 outer membrane protein yopM, putative [Entamoeba invadens IP1]